MDMGHFFLTPSIVGLLYCSFNVIYPYVLGSNYAHLKTAMSSDVIPTQHKLNTRRCKVGCQVVKQREGRSWKYFFYRSSFAVSWAFNILIFHSYSLRLITIVFHFKEVFNISCTNNLSLCFNLEGARRKKKKTDKKKISQNKPKQTNTNKATKLWNKNLFFKSALLILTVLRNAFQSTNLFCCFFTLRCVTFLILFFIAW